VTNPVGEGLAVVFEDEALLVPVVLDVGEFDVHGASRVGFFQGKKVARSDGAAVAAPSLCFAVFGREGLVDVVGELSAWLVGWAVVEENVLFFELAAGVYVDFDDGLVGLAGF
jgi:hypothetical protein